MPKHHTEVDFKVTDFQAAQAAITTNTNNIATNTNQIGIVQGNVTSNTASISNLISAMKGNFINIMYPPPPLVGCKGDGTTDDSVALQNLINSNGITTYISLFAPRATYRIQGVVINSNMRIIGAGWDNTVFKLVDGSTQDVFIVANFNTNTGTNWSGGVSNVHLAHFQIDGNKANCPSGGWCLRRFGYRWNVDTIKAVNGNAGGIYSEWGQAQGVGTDGEFMEDDWSNIRIHDCNNYGFQFRGAHDSRLNDFLVYKINGVGVSIESGSTYSSGGTIINTMHVYSCTGNGIVTTGSIQGNLIESESNGGHGIVLNAIAELTNVHCFNNTGDGVQSLAYDTQIIGLNTHNNTGNGFTLGAAGAPVVANVIIGKSYSNGGIQLNLVNDGGTNKIVMHVYTATGSNLSTSASTYNQTSDIQVIATNSSKIWGTTAQRPTIGVVTGRMFSDTTLGKPMWWINGMWVDSTGSTGSGYGRVTMGAGATSVVVTHNLGSAPITVSATPQGSMGYVWVDNITSTQFTINCSTAPVSAVFVSWHARI